MEAAAAAAAATGGSDKMRTVSRSHSESIRGEGDTAAGWRRSKSLYGRLRDLVAPRRRRLDTNVSCGKKKKQSKSKRRLEMESDVERTRHKRKTDKAASQLEVTETEVEDVSTVSATGILPMVDPATEDWPAAAFETPSVGKYPRHTEELDHEPDLDAKKRGKKKQKVKEKHPGINDLPGLDDHPNHLPFDTMDHYNQAAVRKAISDSNLIKIFGYGRFYIENDVKLTKQKAKQAKKVLNMKLDPDNPECMALLDGIDLDEMERKRIRTVEERMVGRVNRIVDMFMDVVLKWKRSPTLRLPKSSVHSATVGLLWLGRNLAKIVYAERMRVKEEASLPERMRIFKRMDDSELVLINRLPLDIFINDKGTMTYALRQHMLTADKTCQFKVTSIGKDAGKLPDCMMPSSQRSLTRRTCVHHSLSLSTKPCAMMSCENHGRMVCEHIQVFIPETITINSYASMLQFCERFERLEGLKGCIFVTKPSYLNNARGLRFFVNKQQFRYFYHMETGRPTPRQSVLLQRYVEAPRLFNRRKLSLRFFILIVVLPERRVVAFLHTGVGFLSSAEYQPVQRQAFERDGQVAVSNEEFTGERSIGKVVQTTFDKEAHIANYMEPAARQWLQAQMHKGKAEIVKRREDRCYYFADLIKNCAFKQSVYNQMFFIAQRIVKMMQPLIQDSPGCFQTVAADGVLDARNKLWLLSTSTNIFSSMLSCMGRQRYIMSAIVQESIGLAVECAFRCNHLKRKTTKGDRENFWNIEEFKPLNARVVNGFVMAQNFIFFHDTLWGFKEQKPKVKKELPLDERFDQIDEQTERLRKLKEKTEKVKQTYLDLKERRRRQMLLKLGDSDKQTRGTRLS